MSVAITVLHVRGQGPDEIERALDAIFGGEERPQALHLEGTYNLVLDRLMDPAVTASYRYLTLQVHPSSGWTPVLELGNRTVGLEVELSKALGGCDVFTLFVYDDGLSGYVCARGGQELDRYASDPSYFADVEELEAGDVPEDALAAEVSDFEAYRGHPERFADLLPAGTSPEDFVAVVLRPGWWEQQDADVEEEPLPEGDEEAEMVDEADRMRCIGLALELWGPTEYPFAQPAEEIPNVVAGPAVALAYQ